MAFVGTLAVFFASLAGSHGAGYDALSLVQLQSAYVESEPNADGTGRASGPAIAADGWAIAHVGLPASARVDRALFLKTAKQTAPATFLSESFDQYLNDIFDLGTAMMLPNVKNDLGRHCFSYGYMLSKEFYGDKPLDALRLTRGASPDLDRDWQSVAKDAEGRVTAQAFKDAMKAKHGAKVSQDKAASFDSYLDQCFKVGLSMMLPKQKTTLGGHCFRYASMAASEFYFGKSGDDVLNLASLRSGVAVASQGWETAHAGLAPDSRVDRDTFISACDQTAPSAFRGNDFNAYASALFDMGLAMMLPNQKQDLGRHCFSYAFIMSKEFYGEHGAPLDILGLTGGKSADLDADWNAVAKDAAGRVTKDAFKAVMKSKHGSKVEASKAAAFDQYLDAVFASGLAMMLPAQKSTLGGHCFRYAAMAAGEFYFTSAGEDAMSFLPPRTGAQIAASGWTKAHEGIPANARIDRETFVATAMAAAPAGFSAKAESYKQYLNDIFDTGLAMMLPKQKSDLGRHCFSYGFILSKEFYGDAPLDVLSLTKGGSADLDKDWAAVAKDASGRVTEAAFKQVMMNKHRAQLGESSQESFDAYLSQCFKTGLSMMLPKQKTTLGGHCFRYAAMAAGEFYFGGSGADVLKLLPGR